MKKLFKILIVIICMVILFGFLEYNAFFGLFDYFKEQKYNIQELDKEKELMNTYLSNKYPNKTFNIQVNQSFDRYYKRISFFYSHIHYKWVIHNKVTDGEISFEIIKTNPNEYTDNYAKNYNIKHYGSEAKQIIDKYNHIDLDETKLQAFSQLREQGVIYDAGVFADADCFNNRLCDNAQDMADMYITESDMYVGFYFDKVNSVNISKIRNDMDYIKSVIGDSIHFNIGFTATKTNSKGTSYCYDISPEFSDEKIKHIMECYENNISPN